MKELYLRSNCPINFALASFGDAWSLLIIRDLVFWGKHTFHEFLAAKEGIASNILANRLSQLVRSKILTREQDPTDQRKVQYTLTQKGLDLIPLLLELCVWACQHDPHTIASKELVAQIYKDRESAYQKARDTVVSGGSLFG